MLQQTQQALSGVIGGMASQDIAQPAAVDIPGDGAIDITQSGTVTLSKGSAAAITIAAPGTGNIGVEKKIIANSAFAHVVTFTGGTLNSGAAGTATWTAAAHAGSSVWIRAVDATHWSVIAQNLGAFA